MYKTVRHGESSLQYTILPQDADATVTKHTTSSGRTAVLIAICVILVGGVIAAVVVPLLVSTRLVIPAPHRRVAAPARVAITTSYFTTTNNPTTTTSTLPQINTTTESVSSEGPTTVQTEPTQRAWSIVPSIAITTTEAPVLTTTPSISTTEAMTTNPSTVNSTSHLFVTTNRPHKSWLPSRWPFVDPANTYAQWTELARQSALVPAACLGALILAVIIALGACLATRRRRQKANRRRTIGKMSSELQQGDKTTLLTEGSEAED